MLINLVAEGHTFSEKCLIHVHVAEFMFWSRFIFYTQSPYVLPSCFVHIFPMTCLFLFIRQNSKQICDCHCINLIFNYKYNFAMKSHVLKSNKFCNICDSVCTLRKHAYSNIKKILPPKNEIFVIKILCFSYFCSSIDCGYSLEPPRRGGSNEYPQSMFWA